MAGTPLHDHLVGRGAVPADDHGITLAWDFGDVAAEYRALRTGVALSDLGDRVVVRAVGTDRVGFLQGMLSNDVAGLRAGEGCAALLLTIQGRVVADLRVAACDEALLLDVDRRACAAFLEALGRLIIADDVELVPDEATTLVALVGPAVTTVLPPMAPLPPFAHAMASVGDVPVRVVRASVAGGDGAILHVPVAAAPRLWDALVEAGAVPCGRAALEARRIECGVPRIGLDMGEKTLALELPIDGAVSITKGCYLGQEVIARGTARGHVNRRLCGLVLTGAAPAPGAALSRDGHEVGQITSAIHSPALERPVALGFVRREHWDAGTELVVPSTGGAVVARVAAWPLA